MVRLTVLLLATALAAQAQPGSNARTLSGDAWCTRDLDGNGPDGRRAQACEVREVLISATALDLNGSPNGSVTVKRWDRPDVLVRARVLAYARDAGTARRSVRDTRIETAGGAIRARTPRGDQGTTVSFEVFAPRRTGLAVQTQNGAVSVYGLTSGVRVRAVNGSVALAEVGGDVQVQTVNGAVSVAVGDVWTGRSLQIKTTNGSVSLTLPPDISANLDAQTRVGRIALAGLDVAALDRQRAGVDRRSGWTGDRVQARLGRGGSPVRVATTNGSISIRQAR